MSMASDMTSADHAGKSMTEASKDNRLRMSSEVARRFIHGGKGVTDEARPWNDQMAKRVDDLVPKVMTQIEAWRDGKMPAPEEGSDLNPMYDDFAQAKPWITGTFEGRETQMYGPISAFFRFVAHFVKREADKDKSLAKRCRLVLPFKEVNAIPDASLEDKRVDIGLTAVPIDNLVESVEGLSYCTAFAIFEAKRKGDKSLGAAKEDAHAQLLDYTRNLFARQLDMRFSWGISCVDFTVWACLFSNHRVHESNAMDVTTEDGLEQLVLLILSWSFCDMTQLGYDKTLYWDRDLNCYVVKVPNGAPGVYETYYSNHCIQSAERLFGRHCRCILATSTMPNGPVSEMNPIVPDVIIKDTWVMYVDRDASAASDATVAVFDAAFYANCGRAGATVAAAAQANEAADKAARLVGTIEMENARGGMMTRAISPWNHDKKLQEAMSQSHARRRAAAIAIGKARTTVKHAAAAAKTAAAAVATTSAAASASAGVTTAGDHSALSPSIASGIRTAMEEAVRNAVDHAVGAAPTIIAELLDVAPEQTVAARIAEAASESTTPLDIAGIAKDIDVTGISSDDRAAIVAAFVAKAAETIADAHSFQANAKSRAFAAPVTPGTPEAGPIAHANCAIDAASRAITSAAAVAAATSVAAAVTAGTDLAAAAATIMVTATHVATSKPTTSVATVGAAIASASAVTIISRLCLDVNLGMLLEQHRQMRPDEQTRLGWPQPGFDPCADESHALLHSEYKMLEQINQGLAERSDLKDFYPELLCGGWVYQPLDPADSRQSANSRGLNDSLIRNGHVLGSTHEMLGHLDPKYLHNVPFCAAMRIATRPFGRKLHTAKSVGELICALRDAMKCCMAMFEECGILHRDISPNNILIVDRGGGKSCGILIDYDCARHVDGDHPVHPERTGTFPYMSVANLEALNINRTILDDWESLLYMVCVIGTYGIESDREIYDWEYLPIAQWFGGRAEHVARAKRNHMHTPEIFRTDIIDHFYEHQRGVDDLKDLAKKLHRCLFLNRRFEDKTVCQGALQMDPQNMDYNVEEIMDDGGGEDMDYCDYEDMDYYDYEDMDGGGDEAKIDPFAARVDHALDIGNDLLAVLKAAAIGRRRTYAKMRAST